MIFDAADDWLGHERETELIVTARPIVGVVHAPANATGDKLRSNFVTVGIAENSEQIPGLNCGFEARRIKRFSCRSFKAAGKKRVRNNKRDSQ